MATQYEGTILFERVLKANLPTKTAGSKIFFVVTNVSDTIGEIWASGSDGVVRRYSIAADIATINATLVAVQQQINDLIGCGFGKDTVSLGSNVDVLGLAKNVRGKCTSTINHPPSCGGAHCFVYNIYSDANWQEVIYIEYATGLKYRNFKLGGAWKGWELCSDKIASIISYLVNGWQTANANYNNVAHANAGVITIDCIIKNTAQASASAIVVSGLPVKPSKNTIIHGYTDGGVHVHFDYTASGGISLVGTVPNHNWIKIADTVVM